MWLKYLPRSMLGQITILTLALLGIGIYYLAIVPISQMRNEPIDPMLKTKSEFQDDMSTFINAVIAGSDVASARRSLDERYRRIKRRNRDVGYFIRVGGKNYGSGPSRYYRTLGIAELESAKRRNSSPELCITFSKPMPARDGDGYASFNGCDRLSYYEYHGLQTPIVDNGDLVTPYYTKFTLPFSGPFILLVAAMFGSIALILIVNMVRLRRLARVARSFDPETLDRPLPEHGLPVEVISLVRAVNTMIARVDEAQRRRKFFLSAAAHELRTPLTVLRTRLEMLDDSAIKTKLIGDVGRMTSLVNQLLTLMSIGRQRLDSIADLVDCCWKVIDAREPLATRRAIALSFDPAAPALRVQGDAGLIGVAIANLVDNALTFSDDGSSIEIGIDATGRLSVRDHGPGIDEVRKHALFDAFVRLAPGKSGHGLGLAIVRAIVDLHGGHADVVNMPDGGARFTIDFGPLRGDDALPQEPEAVPIAAQAPSTIPPLSEPIYRAPPGAAAV